MPRSRHTMHRLQNQQRRRRRLIATKLFADDKPQTQSEETQLELPGIPPAPSNPDEKSNHHPSPFGEQKPEVDELGTDLVGCLSEQRDLTLTIQ